MTGDGLTARSGHRACSSTSTGSSCRSLVPGRSPGSAVVALPPCAGRFRGRVLVPRGPAGIAGEAVLVAARSDQREGQMYACGSGQSRPKPQDVVVGVAWRDRNMWSSSVIRRRPRSAHVRRVVAHRSGAVVHVAVGRLCTAPVAVVHGHGTEHAFCCGLRLCAPRAIRCGRGTGPGREASRPRPPSCQIFLRRHVTSRRSPIRASRRPDNCCQTLRPSRRRLKALIRRKSGRPRSGRARDGLGTWPTRGRSRLKSCLANIWPGRSPHAG